MTPLFKLKQFFYSLVFNFLDFVFFFTHYWWWKMQWFLMRKYWNVSGYEVFMRENRLRQDVTEEDFSFGETNALSTKLILEEIQPQKGATIYDLGSGRGIFLISAYFIYGTRGVGIEILKTYVEKSRELASTMRVANVLFREENIVDTDLSEADIIYLSGATFSGEILDRTIEKFKKAEPGTIIIIIRHELPEEEFVLFNDGYYPFTWGSEKVYFYRKK
ncbi:MAG: methyltransferase domain-containing protein [Vulcanimicrobiota bacterium]